MFGMYTFTMYSIVCMHMKCSNVCIRVHTSIYVLEYICVEYAHNMYTSMYIQYVYIIDIRHTSGV